MSNHESELATTRARISELERELETATARAEMADRNMDTAIVQSKALLAQLARLLSGVVTAYSAMAALEDPINESTARMKVIRENGDLDG